MPDQRRLKEFIENNLTQINVLQASFSSRTVETNKQWHGMPGSGITVVSKCFKNNNVPDQRRLKEFIDNNLTQINVLQAYLSSRTVETNNGMECLVVV